MSYEASTVAIILFATFVGLVLGISFYFARKSKSASGYFAAGGGIHWFVNGVAFAGDYLSAASFLGICGMIAVAGYDGFLYSIGFLAGWVVALFVVAEPLKRLGKYTFADAIDAKFNSKGIKLAAALSTLVVSIFYLIPQMVGAGALVKPLLGFPHWLGVVLVGAIVILIVATAGMASTTYVQFIKGGMLVVFSFIVVVLVLQKGIQTKPQADYHEFVLLKGDIIENKVENLSDTSYHFKGLYQNEQYAKFEKEGVASWFSINHDKSPVEFNEALSVTLLKDGSKLYNGEEQAHHKFFQVGHAHKIIKDGQEVEDTGSVGPLEFLSIIEQSEITRFSKSKEILDGDSKVVLYTQNITKGSAIMKPGLFYKIGEKSTLLQRFDFISLMLALFFGTAALPHILIRYYTVKSQTDARKSTIVAIGAIGFFYILTLFLGLGAMVNGAIDVENSNMAAPLLAKSIGVFIFSIISAIAFATILGTVSGLIVATSGAIAHDIMDKYLNRSMSDEQKVRTGRMVAIGAGIIAIILGIIFEKQNVTFLVGLAFAIAASANLPTIIMLLFWKKTTSKGIVAGIFVGMISCLMIISLSPTMYEIYGISTEKALIPLRNPGIISIPLGFLALIVVSLFTQKK